MLLSLGADGAVCAARRNNDHDYINVNTLYRPALPVPHCYSTVGAGDNLLAGFLSGFLAAGQEPGFEPVPPDVSGKALDRGLAFAAEQCAMPR